MHKALKLRLLLLLLTLAASSAELLWFLLRTDYLPASCCAVVFLLSLGSILRLYSRTTRKLIFMFHAIENGDYSFKFAERSSRSNDLLINQSLNRIHSLLTKAREETIEQEKYYQLILESVTTGILIINDRGHVTQTNREALRLLGIQPLTHIKQLSRLDEQFPALLRDIVAGESRQLTCRTERGSVTFSVHASSIVRRGEQLRILALTDIENELSDREIESWLRLIRVLTHEIMNSVNPITSISDSLVERIGPDDDSELRRGLATISQTGKNLISFVESYRKFTRLPAPNPTLFYVKEFVENLCALTSATVPDGSRNVDIRISVEPDDLILYADRSMISQVAINLLKNAIEATLDVEHPRIDLTATVDSREQVIIQIENNGPSIPPEVADQIFIPFFTTKSGGSGVGLSLSRQIMRLHGGTLQYRPGPNGTGSIFTLTFR
ncbi:ATP-binding protein [uncultured Rikenella sp.]|uniref:sensor histidine kinase n=1 Tax=uncultured Rikenella sp. TaxID=368003 RepID=UPI0025F68FEB|nr:ATP-binding protein [uncultured Rikenella sp.]